MMICPNLRAPTLPAKVPALVFREVVGMLSGIKDDTNEEIKVETDSEEPWKTSAEIGTENAPPFFWIMFSVS